MGVCDTSDYRVPGKVEGAIYGASCCNVVALIFFICVIFSPFTVWSVNSAANNRFGTGPFVPSASRYDFLCAAGEAYVWCIGTFVPQQWVNTYIIVMNSLYNEDGVTYEFLLMV